MISGKYLLVMPLPCYVDKSGTIYMDRLWRMDFLKHLEYINNLTLACPQLPVDYANTDLEKVVIPEGSKVTFLATNFHQSFLGMCAATPRLVKMLYKAIKSADIVHSGVIGWPFPIGWIANPIALALNKPLVIVIESLHWRDASYNNTIARKTRSKLLELFAKFFVRRATVATFNQPYFRDSLTKPDKPRHTLVNPTVWLDEKDILDDIAASDSWRTKESQNTPIRVVFAGRLVASKGVLTVLEALKRLDAEQVEMEFNIIGDGDLFERCEKHTKHLSHIKLSVHTSIPYGREFFEFIRTHHFAVLPCIVDEQPRIVLDFYSQAIPVLGSNIPGLLHNIDEGKSGWFFERESVEDLAIKIKEAIQSKDELKTMGMYCLNKGKDYTHSRMHEARIELIQKALEQTKETEE